MKKWCCIFFFYNWIILFYKIETKVLEQAKKSIFKKLINKTRNALAFHVVPARVGDRAPYFIAFGAVVCGVNVQVQFDLGPAETESFQWDHYILTVPRYFNWLFLANKRHCVGHINGLQDTVDRMMHLESSSECAVVQHWDGKVASRHQCRLIDHHHHRGQSGGGCCGSLRGWYGHSCFASASSKFWRATLEINNL